MGLVRSSPVHMMQPPKIGGHDPDHEFSQPPTHFLSHVTRSGGTAQQVLGSTHSIQVELQQRLNEPLLTFGGTAQKVLGCTHTIQPRGYSHGSVTQSIEWRSSGSDRPMRVSPWYNKRNPARVGSLHRPAPAGSRRSTARPSYSSTARPSYRIASPRGPHTGSVTARPSYREPGSSTASLPHQQLPQLRTHLFRITIRPCCRRPSPASMMP